MATALDAADQAQALVRARAFAEPLISGETLDTGENTLAHADAVCRILQAIGGSESMQAATYLVYACEHLNKPQEAIAKGFGDNLAALQAAAETLSNRAMRADAMDALVLVREGAPLASAIAQKKRFPGLLPMFARLGEQTGQLPVMLQRAANQLGAEVQRRAVQLATILEPLLMVAMGLVVMLIVLAVLLPIIQLNQFVK